MTRIIATAVFTAFLSACSTMPEWAVAFPFLDGIAQRGEPAQYSFDWHLSGERQVAPIQVFDNGKQTWLQFLPDQIVPAIFQHTAQGERVLSPVRHGDYLILDGVWPTLSFRGGSLHASAEKRLFGSADNATTTSTQAVPSESSTMAGLPDPSSGTSELVSLPASVDTVSEQELRVTDDVRRLTEASFVIDHDVMQSTHSAGNRISSDADSELTYEIRLKDRNLRLALHRWAAQAQWTFAPEHWDVDIDIPISGEAVFQGTFQDVVQDVLSATELAERPLRPCFYSNRVLRVVSYTQSCDRSGARVS